MRVVPRCLVLCVIVGVGSPSVAASQTAQDHLTLEDYLAWERVSDPRISPDGSTVLYTRRWVDIAEDRWTAGIWQVDTDGTRNRHVIDGASPRWSPDGTRIAFLDQDEDGRTQIFIRWMDAEGAVSQVTRLAEHTPSDPVWSPDGSQLAFRMRVPPEASALDHWSIDLPRPRGSKWTEDPRITESLVFRQDRVGHLDEGVWHLYVVPAEGGTPRRVTRGDHDHAAPAWTADGQALLTSGLREPDAEYRWQESEIYRVDVASGAVEQLTTRKGPDRGPVPSPDGRHIAYVGYDTTGVDYIESALYVMDADGGNPRDLTSSMDRTPRNPIWDADGEGLYFTVPANGHSNVHHVSLTGVIRAVTEGAHMMALTSLSRGGVAVGTLEGPQTPQDVVAFDVDRPERPTQLTRVNDDVLAGKTLGEVEEITYTSFDGLEIGGWIIRPPDFDPARRYPMMLVIHGGPHGMYDIGFNFGWQEHAANGYVVLYTEPARQFGLRQRLRECHPVCVPRR